VDQSKQVTVDEKDMTELYEKLARVELELNDALNILQAQENYRKQRDEARYLVRKLLDPDWRKAGVERDAFSAVRDWGLGVIS
jgi:hypothetical protein